MPDDGVACQIHPRTHIRHHPRRHLLSPTRISSIHPCSAIYPYIYAMQHTPTPPTHCVCVFVKHQVPRASHDCCTWLCRWACCWSHSSTTMATVTASSLAISASGPAISPHTGRNHCAGHRATSASFMNSELFARSATLSPHAAVVSRPVESRRPSVFTVCKVRCTRAHHFVNCRCRSRSCLSIANSDGCLLINRNCNARCRFRWAMLFRRLD